MGQNAWYRTLIEEQSAYKGQRDNFLFDVVDMDGDGGLDLIMSYYDTTLEDYFAWSASYNKYISGEGGFTSDSHEFFYCTETGYTKVIRRYENWDVTFYEKMFGDLGEYVFYKTDAEGNYVEFDDATESGLRVITDEATIAEYESWKTTYMPTETPGLGKYEATSENLDLYLPLEEETTEMPVEELWFPTGEYTLGTVTLGVGEVFALSNENIDELLMQEGIELSSSVNRVYYDESVIIDSNYVSKTLYYGFYDPNTMELVQDGYWTAEESNEFFSTGVDGKWFYEGKEVIPVEEGEGVAYYNIRADKAGTTTVTISYYQVEEAAIKLTIPFNIIETSVEVPAIPQPEVPVENIIVSTTDSTISISDSANVLPAGTTINTTKVETGDRYNFAIATIQSNIILPGNVAVYDINLFDGNNVELNQLNGKVKVTMDIPFEVTPGKTINVYRVEGTTLIACPTSIVDGKLVFETDHFSTYVAVEEVLPLYNPAELNQTTTTDVPTQSTTENTVQSDNGIVISPKTGDTSVNGYVIVMCIAAAAFVLVNKKNVRV